MENEIKKATGRAYTKGRWHDAEDRFQCPYCGFKQSYLSKEKEQIETCCSCQKQVLVVYRTMGRKNY
jgi:transcription elongation factor Elf1